MSTNAGWAANESFDGLKRTGNAKTLGCPPAAERLSLLSRFRVADWLFPIAGAAAPAIHTGSRMGRCGDRESTAKLNHGDEAKKRRLLKASCNPKSLEVIS